MAIDGIQGLNDIAGGTGGIANVGTNVGANIDLQDWASAIDGATSLHTNVTSKSMEANSEIYMLTKISEIWQKLR